MPVPQRQLGWMGTLHSGGAGEWMDIGAIGLGREELAGAAVVVSSSWFSGKMTREAGCVTWGPECGGSW